MLESCTAYKRWAVEVGSIIKGTGLYLTKRGSGGITSSFVATKTNLGKLYDR